VRRASPLAGVALAVAVVTAITLVLFPLTKLDPGVSSGMLYVLGVLLLAMNWGLWLGIGGARPSGSGLLGMRDRLETADGRLRVDSPSGGGTVVVAAIPLQA
jgi:hypothetical protein